MASNSTFCGKWRLYGTENAHLFAETFNLPQRIASTLVHLRPQEEVHVNGDNVHIRVDVPGFELPGYTVEKNIQIGHPSTAPLLTTGTLATGPLRKVSETLWETNLTCEETGKAITVTREIIGGEMWVTIQTCGTKMTHKYERADLDQEHWCGERPPCPSGSTTCACSTVASRRTSRAAQCAESLCCPADLATCPIATTTSTASSRSPFVGTWSMYGTEGSDQFYAARNVPVQIRQYLSHMSIVETIHVNGTNVHIRICVAPIRLPARVHEINWKFDKEYNYVCPFSGTTAKGTATKESDSKWVNTISGLKTGLMTVTRELRNNEMWLTFQSEKCHIIRKFERCHHPHHDREENHKDHGHHEHGSHHGHDSE